MCIRDRVDHFHTARQSLITRRKFIPPAGRDVITVSYTHLRAHETDSYLVCRLLLEKKKKNVYHYIYFFFFLMIRRPPRSTPLYSSAASDVYKRQIDNKAEVHSASWKGCN